VNVDELISLSPSLSMSKMTRIIKGDLLDHSRSVLCTATPPRKLSVDQWLYRIDGTARARSPRPGRHLTSHGRRVW
jgi:hypothetical protein